MKLKIKIFMRELFILSFGLKQRCIDNFHYFFNFQTAPVYGCIFFEPGHLPFGILPGIDLDDLHSFINGEVADKVPEEFPVTNGL